MKQSKLSARLNKYYAQLYVAMNKMGLNGKLNSYKDKHKGETCIIFGNGPSLREIDFAKLSKVVHFFSNGIYKHEHFNLLKGYYTQVDITQAQDWYSDYKQLNIPNKIVSRKNFPYHPFSADTVVLKDLYSPEMAPEFSMDVRNGAYHAGTVTYVNMQLAYYMGFKKVLLLGIDHNWPDAVLDGKGKVSVDEKLQNVHFTNAYYKEGMRFGVPDKVRIENAYTKAKNVFEADGRVILNCSPASKLEVYERAPQDSVYQA